MESPRVSPLSVSQSSAVGRLDAMPFLSMSIPSSSIRSRSLPPSTPTPLSYAMPSPSPSLRARASQYLPPTSCVKATTVTETAHAGIPSTSMQLPVPASLVIPSTSIRALSPSMSRPVATVTRSAPTVVAAAANFGSSPLVTPVFESRPALKSKSNSFTKVVVAPSAPVVRSINAPIAPATTLLPFRSSPIPIALKAQSQSPVEYRAPVELEQDSCFHVGIPATRIEPAWSEGRWYLATPADLKGIEAAERRGRRFDVYRVDAEVDALDQQGRLPNLPAPRHWKDGAGCPIS